MSQDMANQQVAPMVRTVDEVMPPLRPQRGRPSKVAKAYEAAREQFRVLLAKLEAGASYNRAIQADLDSALRTNEILREDFKDLQKYAANVQRQLYSVQNGRRNDVRDLIKGMLTATQFCRLTGLELKDFRSIDRDDNMPMMVTFKAGDYTATIVNGVPSHLVLKCGLRQEMKFNLEQNGAIPTQPALAIMGLTGIQRDHKEAFSEQVYREIYGDPKTSMLDELLGGKRASLGAIGLFGALATDYGDPNCPEHGRVNPNPGGLFG